MNQIVFGSDPSLLQLALALLLVPGCRFDCRAEYVYCYTCIYNNKKITTLILHRLPVDTSYVGRRKDRKVNIPMHYISIKFKRDYMKSNIFRYKKIIIEIGIIGKKL